MTNTSAHSSRVCFFITIYNEAEALPKLLEQISRIKLPEGISAYSVYAVDDASTDTTPQVLETLKASYPLTVLRYEKNKGVPATFKEAFNFFAKNLEDSDIVILMEGDGTSDVSAAPGMLQKILDGNDIAIASRHAHGGAYVRFPWYRIMGSSLINLFLRIMWGVRGATDYTIFYRAYRVSLIKKSFMQPTLHAKRSFAVNGEILLQLSEHEPKIAEVPLRYDYGLKKGPSRMNLVAALKEYMRLTLIYRFSPKRIGQFLFNPITLVAFGSFLLHVWGVMYGFPDLLVLDEPSLTRGALTMLKLHTLIPALHPADFATMYYPPFTAYLYLIALLPVVGISFLLSQMSLGAFTTHLLLDPTVPWVATRVVSALLGTLSVYFLGRLSEKLWKGSGVFAALFLATSFLHVTFSHIARHWSLSTLLVVFMMWAAYEILVSGRRSAYIWAGICAGLGAGTGVITAAFGILPALSHLFRPEGILTKFRSPRIWIMGITALAILALSFALHPLILSNLLAGGDNQGITIASPKSLDSLGKMLTFVVRDLAWTETALFIFAFIGLPFFLRKHRQFGIALAASAFIYVLIIYFGYYYLLHYLQLILPVLALFAAVGVAECIRVAKYRWLKVVLIICIFALPTLVALRFSYLWAQPDTRHDARAYIEANIPMNARIISNVPNMKIVWPERGVLQERIAFDPASSRLLDTTLLALPAAEYPAPVFQVFELSTLSLLGMQKITPEFLQEGNFDYAVVDASAPEMPALTDALSRGTVIARFPHDGKAINIIANEFEGPSTDVFSIRQMGPEVRIVKLFR